MDTALQDVRYAVRQLVRSPGFAVVAILTLALGIGANTAIFSVVNGVVLRPLPYSEPERLAALEGVAGLRGVLLEMRDRAESFERLESFTGAWNRSHTGDGEPLRVESSFVTAGLFEMLDVTPELGRTFRPDENGPSSTRS